MINKLLPCPFCGRIPDLFDHGPGTGGWMVACDCGIMKTRTATCGELPSYVERMKQVITQWNTRPGRR